MQKVVKVSILVVESLCPTLAARRSTSAAHHVGISQTCSCIHILFVVTGSNPGCARRYPCCGGEEGSSGCRQQCSYCKVTWGEFDSEVGCIGRSHHNVIRLEQQ